MKALLKVNLFNVGSGNSTTPIGLGLIARLFEPALLRNMSLGEYAAVRSYLSPFAAKHTDIKKVKDSAKQMVPKSFPAEERAAFLSDLDSKNDLVDVLECALRFFGKTVFEATFPLE